MTRKAAQFIARKHIEAIKAGTAETLPTHKTIKTLSNAIYCNTGAYILYCWQMSEKAIQSRNESQNKLYTELYRLANHPDFIF